jgi:hypothetical protein
MGTAANFGFSEVGNCARERDYCLGPLKQQDQAPDDATQARITQLLMQLQQHAETATGT